METVEQLHEVGMTANSSVANVAKAQEAWITPRFGWRLDRHLFFIKQRFFYTVSYFLLDNQVCGRVRARLLRLLGARVGKRCFVRGGLQIQEGFRIALGDGVFINAGCCFDTSAPIYLSDNVQIAYQVTLITGGHEIGPRESRAGCHRPASIRIGKGAWIGARATILPGVVVGAGAVVAAGALVTKSVPPDTLVAGVPARPIRQLPVDEVG